LRGLVCEICGEQSLTPLIGTRKAATKAAIVGLRAFPSFQNTRESFVMSHSSRAVGAPGHLPTMRQPRLDLRRCRRDWVVIGFWLGGLGFGTLGAVVGLNMSHRHPALSAVSVFWWNFYLGCFGSSLGALLGMAVSGDAANPTPAPAPPEPTKPPDPRGIVPAGALVFAGCDADTWTRVKDSKPPPPSLGSP
jgi:hypothetical protein